MTPEDLLHELDAMRKAAEAVFRHRQFVLGPEVSHLEKLLSELFLTRHAIGCNSGFGAHLITLIALGIGPEARVAVPAFGPYSYAGTIRRRRATPVFFDVARGEFEAGRDEIDHVSEPVTAAVFHDLFYGLSSPDALANRFPRLPLVRVATHSFAALLTTPTSNAGTTATTLCLRDTATLGAPGDAGLILTNDDVLADRIRYVRSETNAAGEHEGFDSGNFHQDTLHAAFLIEMLNQRLAVVRTRSHRIRDLLDNIRERSIPGLHIPRAAASVCSYPVVCIRDRESLLRRLRDQGLQAKTWWPTPLPLQHGFLDLGYKRGAFPNSEQAAAENVELPIPSSKSEYDLLLSTLIAHCSESAEHEKGPAQQ